MSLSFPHLSLPTCLTWKFNKRSQFSTTLQRPKSKRRLASSTLQQGVIYELELNYEFLKNQGRTYEDDVAYLQGFYEACRGGFAWFTFDPSEYSLDSMSVAQDVNALRSGFFSMGDAATTVFQLWRSTSALTAKDAAVPLVARVELIQCVVQQPSIYIDGELADPSTYAFSNFPAKVTFNTPPAAGAWLSWEGGYRYLCRFSEDVLDVEEFLYQLWELQSLKLETVNL